MPAEPTPPTEPPEHGYLQSDEPIARRSEDRLNRARLSEAIAEQIIFSPPKQGFVIAIDGPWGSGKTSVLNMIEEVVSEKSATVVLRFNPWLFSGTEELVLRFLHELGTQLGEGADGTDERLRQIGERLASYGDVLVPLGWVPVVGGWLSRGGALARAVGNRRRDKAPPSALAQHNELRDALAALDRRVLVVVDDLDRIEAGQIRDVVRLIKLVADFPNVTYLLGYDADRVAGALADDIATGRDYLEKIVQVTHRLPEISDALLVRVLGAELDALLQPIEHGPFSHDDWVNIFHTAMRPFFKNVRDVRRYLNAVPVTLRVLGREVSLVDALALETLRIFAPAAFTRLPAMAGTLTGEGRERDTGSASREREESDARAVEEFVEAASPHQDAVRHLLMRLFPRVGRHVGGTSILGSDRDYRRGRRVAHSDVLRLYLRQTLPEGVTPAHVVDEAYNNLGNRERLTEILDGLDADQLEDMLGRLEDYYRDFDPAVADTAVEVVINQMPRLREEQRGMLDIGSRFAARRVVLRVLERVEDERERLAIVERVLPRIEQLSGREELIDLVGHRENVGHELIPDADAQRLYREHHEQVLAAEPSVLANERQLGSLFYRAVEFEDGVDRERIRELCDDDAVFLQLLRSILTEHRSQTVGDVAVQTTPALPWQMMADLVGDEARLRERVADVGEHTERDDLDDRTRLALETAERYASGELEEPRLR